MKQTSLTKKIPGGKLLRVDIGYSDRVEQVKITGDFFLHPEDVLSALEDTIRGTLLPIDSDGLALQLEAVLCSQHAEIIGFSPADLAEMIVEAVQ
ncbi:MAG: hypothetical protein HPY45_11425 [Anaerolineae bacterium]|nr:hypothetical protein [Anaerolineae bacterium]